MPVLFISHSSKDDKDANALEAWLRANGFSDVFIDHEGIAGGEKWRDALRVSAGAYRVVLCLVSTNWLSSLECFDEFGAAWYMGKRIIPLFLLPTTASLNAEAKTRLDRVCGEDQGIDLNACIDARGTLFIDADVNAANRLKTGLRAAGANTRVGLDPEAFAVDVKLRPTPFPGLSSFSDDDADAGLFYGRSREIAHTLEDLRSMRALNDQRPLVIQGASGAGKSSLLKAGIIPRLRREAPAWLPLRAFRPGADPLLNFAEAFARTFADYGQREAHGVIRDRLLETWTKAERDKNELTAVGLASLEVALDAEGEKLRGAAGRPSASILISVDQAEEIARADGKSGEALADYLRAALVSTKSPWQLAFTIRTDSFPELQSHRRFQDLEARGYDLRAIPVFRFDSVVEEPAKRYSVTVDPLLVDALMEDAPKEDALPLLAFALQRLWRQYAASGSLSKDNYDKVGGLTGLIENAAERATRGLEPEQDVPLPSGPPPKRQTDLAAATFVPALAEINDQGAAIRHIADWSIFNEEQQDLLKRFDRWRLVVRKGEAGGGTVEVAHEALFRTWKRLQSWLEPERARLEALRALQVDAANWERNGQDRGFLNHREERLAEARSLSGNPGYARRLIKRDFDYLAACYAAERAAIARARRGKALVGALAACVIGVFGLGYSGFLDPSNLKIQARKYMDIYMPTVLTAEQERALNHGDVFRECASCPEMVVIRAGKFKMGASEGARPVHEVTIAQKFAVARFTTTFDEWDACVAHNGCSRLGGSAFGRGRQPVIHVNWKDAQQYATWLSRQTGRSYRLLSEAEWEYAARADTETQFSFGDDETALPDYAWFDKNSGHKAHPVGEKKSNAFGLYDMHGNVWQWVEDCHHDSYREAPDDGSVWTGQCENKYYKVIRGGGWGSGAHNVRSASRLGANFDDPQPDVGFRVARTLSTGTGESAR
jgi:formylglycine-generating enzyme required for sulfatase activity